MQLRLAKFAVFAVLLAPACDSFSESHTGDLRVSAITTGGDVDLDGYAVRVDGVSRAALAVNGVVVIRELATGSHEVVLSDVAPNCTLGTTSIAAIVQGGKTTNMDFTVTCAATGVRVTVATSGIDLDVDGYAVTVDGVAAGVISVNGTLQVSRLPAGISTVTLSGVATNCPVGGDNPRSVTVALREITAVAFSVTCGATTGIVEIRASTAGLDPDANGYTVRLNGGAPSPLPSNGVVRFSGLAPADYSISLDGAAPNCAVGGANPRSLSVTGGGATRDTARTTFALSCVAVTGVVEVTAATSGVDLDANGYAVQVDDGSALPLGVNGTVRSPGIAAGSHSIMLGGVAPNCAVSGDNPRTLTVAVGGLTRDTARTSFVVTCESAAGTARIITTTSGADTDPDGYGMGVDCYDYYGGSCYYNYHYEAMSPNDTVVLVGVPSGSHTFQIDGVAPNCTVSGENPRTVHVAGGATTEIVLTVGCTALGRIQVTTTTTGVDLDATGYRITANGVASNIAVNETVTLSGLAVGSYTVSLSGVSLNCTVTTPHPVVVSVTSGTTVTVDFGTACTAATQLAFAMNTSAGFEIHTVGSNHSAATPLTNNTAFENAPDWSPDGSQIAFGSDRDGNPEIYVMQANGSGQTRRTNHAGGDYRPAWSPDGTKIAFVSTRDGNVEIYVMDSSGTGLQRLTNDAATDDVPAWSPDGTKIAFTSNRGGAVGIHVMNSSDGSAVTQLTSDASADSKLAWSPDGTRIAFSRIVACDYYVCRRGLYVMNADGSGVTQLTSGDDYADYADPAWSPDGQWIAFNAAPCDYYGCYDWAIRAVRSNGTDQREISGSLAIHPAWRP